MLKFFILQLAVVCISFNVSANGNDHGKGHGEAKHHEPLFPQKVRDPNLGTRPGKAKLVEPAFEAKVSNSVQLKWQAAEGAEAYHVQVATDPNFKWLVANEPMLKDTSFEVKDLAAGKHYYWRVAGLKTNNDAGLSKGFFSASMFATK